MTKPGIFLISREDDIDYDEYDSFVVVAMCPSDAVRTHPSFKMGDPNVIRYLRHCGEWFMIFDDGTVDTKPACNAGGWTDDLESLSVEYVGEAMGGHMLGRVICSSFRAG